MAERKKLREEQIRQESALAQMRQAALGAEREALERDPDVPRRQRRRELIALIREESALVLEQIDFYARLAQDATASDQTRIEAQRELLRLESARFDLDLKRRDLESQTFAATMERGLRQMADNFGDLGVNVAVTGLDAIHTAVNGVSDAIMGAIDGTRTWGQVFAQVGRGIIANLIQVFTQWIFQKLILDRVEEILSAKKKARNTA